MSDKKHNNYDKSNYDKSNYNKSNYNKSNYNKNNYSKNDSQKSVIDVDKGSLQKQPLMRRAILPLMMCAVLLGSGFMLAVKTGHLTIGSTEVVVEKEVEKIVEIEKEVEVIKEVEKIVEVEKIIEIIKEIEKIVEVEKVVEIPAIGFLTAEQKHLLDTIKNSYFNEVYNNLLSESMWYWGNYGFSVEGLNAMYAEPMYERLMLLDYGRICADLDEISTLFDDYGISGNYNDPLHAFWFCMPFEKYGSEFSPQNIVNCYNSGRGIFSDLDGILGLYTHIYNMTVVLPMLEQLDTQDGNVDNTRIEYSFEFQDENGNMLFLPCVVSKPSNFSGYIYIDQLMNMFFAANGNITVDSTAYGNAQRVHVARWGMSTTLLITRDRGVNVLVIKPALETDVYTINYRDYNTHELLGIELIEVNSTESTLYLGDIKKIANYGTFKLYDKYMNYLGTNLYNIDIDMLYGATTYDLYVENTSIVEVYEYVFNYFDYDTYEFLGRDVTVDYDGKLFLNGVNDITGGLQYELWYMSGSFIGSNRYYLYTGNLNGPGTYDIRVKIMYPVEEEYELFTVEFVYQSGVLCVEDVYIYPNDTHVFFEKLHMAMGGKNIQINYGMGNVLPHNNYNVSVDAFKHALNYIYGHITFIITDLPEIEYKQYTFEFFDYDTGEFILTEEVQVPVGYTDYIYFDKLKSVYEYARENIELYSSNYNKLNQSMFELHMAQINNLPSNTIFVRIKTPVVVYEEYVLTYYDYDTNDFIGTEIIQVEKNHVGHLELVQLRNWLNYASSTIYYDSNKNQMGKEGAYLLHTWVFGHTAGSYTLYVKFNKPDVIEYEEYILTYYDYDTHGFIGTEKITVEKNYVGNLQLSKLPDMLGPTDVVTYYSFGKYLHFESKYELHTSKFANQAGGYDLYVKALFSGDTQRIAVNYRDYYTDELLGIEIVKPNEYEQFHMPCINIITGYDSFSLYFSSKVYFTTNDYWASIGAFPDGGPNDFYVAKLGM